MEKSVGLAGASRGTGIRGWLGCTFSVWWDKYALVSGGLRKREPTSLEVFVGTSPKRAAWRRNVSIRKLWIHGQGQEMKGSTGCLS